MTRPLLELENLSAGYGAAQVISGLSLNVKLGEAVAVLGRNGMGKTTMVRAIIGQTGWRRGQVRLAGEDTTGWPPHRLAHSGVAVVPEGRQVFPNLTVRENLTAFTARRSPQVALHQVLGWFPALADRMDTAGAHLSGGELQMVAIARAIRASPRLMIIDEATEGLAPPVRSQVWECLRALRSRGMALVVIDRNLSDLLRLTDTGLILERGRIAWQGPSRVLVDNPAIAQRALGLAGA